MIRVVRAWVIYNLQSEEWESITNMKHKLGFWGGSFNALLLSLLAIANGCASTNFKEEIHLN